MKYKFHSIDLSYNQQAAILEFSLSRKMVPSDAITTAVEKDKKITFSYDGYHNCMLMSVTPKDKEHPFYGYVNSVRHEDFETLCRVLFWLEGGGWDEIEEPAVSDSRYSWG